MVEGNTWNLEIFQRADPILPVVVRRYVADPNAELPGYEYFHIGPYTTGEGQVTTEDLWRQRDAFRDGKQAYRINGQSVTGIASLPALAATGVLYSAQAEFRPTKMATTSFTTLNVSGQQVLAGSNAWYPTDQTGSAALPADPIIHWYTEEPPVNQLLTGTIPYTAPARQGFYQPLRIAPGHMVSTDSWISVMGSTATYLADNDRTHLLSYAMPERSTGFPYYLDMQNKFFRADVLKPYGYMTGITRIEGLPANGSYTITLIQDVEYVPSLTSTERCSLARPPGVPEQWAIDTYENIVMTLQDAYPASYNDSSVLLTKLRALIKKVLPYVSRGVNIAAVLTGMPELATAGVMIDRLDNYLQKRI